MSLKTPRTRKEFENHIDYISEHFEEVVKGIPSLTIMQSLKNVVILPNNRPNLLTINTHVRLLANSQATFRSEAFKNFVKMKSND